MISPSIPRSGITDISITQSRPGIRPSLPAEPIAVQILPDNPFKFAGKERLDRAGLPLYDFGARWYNPATPAWTTPDPLAEKYYDFSPHAYCAGDPVNRIDPIGKHDYILNKDGSWKKKDTKDHFDLVIAPTGDSMVILNQDIMGNMNQDTGIIENDKYFLYRESQDLEPSMKRLHYSIFDGNDPEAPGQGLDFGVRYPMTRIFNVGAQINF